MTGATTPDVPAAPPPQEDAPVFLHIGAGSAGSERLPPVFQGWREIRVDIDAAVKPDIIASMISMKPIEDQSVDAIWCSHSLEHLEAHQVPLALKEWLRVLKADGFAYVTLPDLQQVAEIIANDRLTETVYVSPMGPISALDMVYGHRGSIEGGSPYMAHRTGFTARTLGETFAEAGFAKTDVWREGLNLWAKAYKSTSFTR
ncbi:MAG: methyltransferase domain-containing protein [Roseibium sp.]|nr:methyltransferase domain-containing protein [Roseibium sp.]